MATDLQRSWHTCTAGSRRDIASSRDQPPLNRISEVLEREAVTPRTLAKRMKMTVRELKDHIHPDRDLTLSDLYRLQDVLQVPISELLVELDTTLSEPIKLRAQLLRLMRTVHSIQEKTTEEPVQRLSQQMAEQLLDIMPELKGVSSWPSVGQRRTLDELGAIVERCVSASVFQPPQTDSMD